MKPFKRFIIEQEEEQQAEGQKLKHLEHINRRHITGGNEGVMQQSEVLDDMENIIRGKKGKGRIKVKRDGSPSLVFGHHPETGEFFVATKSAFNKNPKLNFTKEDIIRNHGHAPGLVDKLNDALENLPKIMPPRRKVGGRYPDQVYQGDVEHSGPKDITKSDGEIAYRPNTVEYRYPENSPEAQQALRSKIGISIHTKYKGNSLDNMSATPDVADNEFNSHPDVHQVSTSVRINPDAYSPEMQREFQTHKALATKTYASMKPDALDKLRGHEVPLEAYMNGIIRRSATAGPNDKPEKPTVDGYVKHLTAMYSKMADSKKSAAGKQKVLDKMNQDLAHVNAHAEHFQKAMDYEQHLSRAKNVLVRALDKMSTSRQRIRDRETGHEGYVHTDSKGNITKSVDQSAEGFAAANLAQFGKQAGGQ